MADDADRICCLNQPGQNVKLKSTLGTPMPLKRARLSAPSPGGNDCFPLFTGPQAQNTPLFAGTPSKVLIQVGAQSIAIDLLEEMGADARVSRNLCQDMQPFAAGG